MTSTDDLLLLKTPRGAILLSFLDLENIVWGEALLPDKGHSNITRINRRSNTPAAAPPSDSLWTRWTRMAPGVQPLIMLFAAFATLMVALAAYYSGVIKAQDRVERAKLCNLVGYRNSAYLVERYIVDTLTSKRHGDPEAQTTAIFKATNAALNAIPLKDLPANVVSDFVVLIAASDLAEAYALKINKEDPKDPATTLSASDHEMLKKADEQLETAMAAIDEELTRFGVTFTTNDNGAKLANAAGCQPPRAFGPQ